MPLSAVAARRLAAQREHKPSHQEERHKDLPTSESDLYVSEDIAVSSNRSQLSSPNSALQEQHGTKRRRTLQNHDSRMEKVRATSSPHPTDANVSCDLLRPEGRPLTEVKFVDSFEQTVELDTTAAAPISDTDDSFDAVSPMSEDEKGPRDNEQASNSIYDDGDFQMSTVDSISVVTDSSQGIQETVVWLSPGRKLTVIGKYKMQVRKGSVAVLGAVLHAGKSWIKICAPSSHALPVIRSLQHPKSGSKTPAEVVLTTLDDGLESLHEFHPAFSRIWCENKERYQILQRRSDDSLGRPLREFQEDSRWHMFVQGLLDKQKSRTPKVAICGPKASGKSSFMRFLSNALMSSSNSTGVILLDIDPGQPEFGLPGDLSLTLLKEFILGPPFSHSLASFRESLPIKAHHFGFLSPRDDPDHYEDCVLDLFKTYHTNYGSHPLIINFSGWILGRGLDCLESIMAAITPSDIVYTSNDGPVEVLSALGKIVSDFKSQLLILSPSIISANLQRSAADLRLMQTMSYFHGTDASAQPSWTPRPVLQSHSRQWSFQGKARMIDAIVIYHDMLGQNSVHSLVSGSVLSLVAVQRDEILNINTDETWTTSSRDDHTQIDTWVDDRILNASVDYEDQTNPKRDSVHEEMRLRRSEEGLPFYISSDGTYKPIDSSKSQALGHVYVKKIDGVDRALHVISPVSESVLQERRAIGDNIVLVRGRLDPATWVLTEPYYQSLSKGTEESKDGRPKSVEDGTIDYEYDTDMLDFDAGRWIANTPRIQFIDRKDRDERRRMKPWRIRRNLETSGNSHRAER